MREFKFRGKAVNPEELDDLDIPHEVGWVYGNLIINNGRPYIVGNVVESCDEYIAFEYWVRVDPKTVGQYTGEDDDKGKEIYDEDIVKGHYWLSGKENRFIGVIVYKGTAFRAEGIGKYKGIVTEFYTNFEVIGNIHDNPELLGE